MRILVVTLALSSLAWAGRTFNGTSDCLNSSAVLSLNSQNQAAFAFQVSGHTFGNNDKLWAETSTNYNNNSGSILIDPNSSASGVLDFNFSAGDGGVTVAIHKIARPSNTTLHTYALNITNGTGAKATVDAVSQSVTEAGLVAQSTQDRTLYLMSRACASLWDAGSMFYPAVWDVNLTLLEQQAMTLGEPPQLVHGGPDLRHCWPLIGLSPEPDLCGRGNSLTVTGTTVTGGGLQNPLFPAGLSAY